MDQDYGLTSSRGGFHPGLASSTSSSSLSGVAQGGIYGLASSYGGLHPGIASSTSSSSHPGRHLWPSFLIWSSSHSGVAQGGIYGHTENCSLALPYITAHTEDCVPLLLLLAAILRVLGLHRSAFVA